MLEIDQGFYTCPNIFKPEISVFLNNNSIYFEMSVYKTCKERTNQLFTLSYKTAHNSNCFV